MGVVIQFPAKKRQTTLSQIVSETCDHFDITFREFVCKRRSTQSVRPRHAACFLARELTTNSFPEIGSYMRRDHTSIIHSAERGAELYASNEAFRRAVDSIRARVTGYDLFNADTIS